jgi:hypothetical protein
MLGIFVMRIVIMKLVHGIGINNKERPSRMDGEMLQEYSLWKSMIGRCYKEYNLEKTSSYKGCNVSFDFLQYHLFFDWCRKQKFFGKKHYCLDKDLIKKGNKTYSPDFCCFIPSELNSLLTKSDSARGELPIGVYYDRGKYKARMKIYGKTQTLGGFDTIEKAFIAYKTAKEKHIKNMAEKYKQMIDERAYKALLNYTVEITD